MWRSVKWPPIFWEGLYLKPPLGRSDIQHGCLKWVWQGTPECQEVETAGYLKVAESTEPQEEAIPIQYPVEVTEMASQSKHESCPALCYEMPDSCPVPFYEILESCPFFMLSDAWIMSCSMQSNVWIMSCCGQPMLCFALDVPCSVWTIHCSVSVRLSTILSEPFYFP